MKLDEIVKELNQELDNMEKDESISKIAAYINESWEQKTNFMQYLFNKYSTKPKNSQGKNPMRKYFYGAAAVTVGFAVTSYAFLKTPPIDNAISVFLVGYISLLAAAEIGKNKTAEIINNSLDYALKNGNFKEDLLDFYKNIKN
ncbi:hypothetical protein M1494_01845 [Candidatus Parvarchaeota archaeon]|nr:hypothetical protein [Candidatus Parvarchaeota archaeon]